ncbi:MAG TPA: type VI secretion system tube protein Hcp [Gammaproteobacteria bacterium]|nr:type VI secretion system tube protein Hcp [Gammaproteobacteria bacterium]
MPLQMHMKMEGILGEAKIFKYKGWSEVLSWNWGMTSNRKLTQGSNGGKTAFDELSIIKPIGIDSAGIRLLFAQGSIIPSVEFSVTPAVGKREAATKYVYIKMEDVVIKSIVTGGSIDDNFFKEHITMLFDRIRFEYSRNAVIGNDNKDEMALDYYFGWKVPENLEWCQ